MTDQEINRAMAEALTRMHFDQRLLWQSWRCVICQPDEPIFTSLNETHLKGSRWMDDDAPLIFRCPWKNHDAVEGYEPHDFSQGEHLFPVLEAYCAEYQTEFTCEPYEGGAVWAAVMRPANSAKRFDGDAPKLGDALRNAFAAALGVGE